MSRRGLGVIGAGEVQRRQVRREALMIDVLDDLTEACRESRQALIRVREAAKSGNCDLGAAMKGWLAAEQKRRAAWLAMATPLPASEE